MKIHRIALQTLLCCVLMLCHSAMLDAQSNKALSFNGTSQYVNIPDANALDVTTSYTIEAWICPASFSSFAGIVSKWHTDGNGYLLRLGSSGTYSGIGFDGLETADGILTANKWYHIAAVNDNGTRTLYVNGTAVAMTGSAVTVSANTDPVTIGVDYLPSPRYFNGKIDEVRIWNVARTATEIREKMHLTLTGSETGLVGYWKLDDASGTTAADGAGSNDGTLTNLPLWVSSSAPLGNGTSVSVTGFTTGIASLGDVSITMTNDFDNPVDLVATEITGAPNQTPSTSYTLLDGNKYWIVEVYGTPGFFYATTTFMYGAVDINASEQSTPSSLVLYKRNSNDDGSWSSAGTANSADASQNSVTFSSLTSFGQFMVAMNSEVFAGPTTDIRNVTFKSGDTWGYTGSPTLASSFIATSSGSFTNLGVDGYSWYVHNTIQTITLDNVTFGSYTSPVFSLPLINYASDITSSDSIIVEVSTNNGSSWSREAVWYGKAFTSGTASVTYDGDNTPSVFTGSYTSIAVLFPASVTQARFRVTMKTGGSTYEWYAIDKMTISANVPAPTKISISSVDPSIDPELRNDRSFGLSFNTLNDNGENANVVEETEYSLSLMTGTGTGTLSGGTTGTLLAGTNSGSLSGLSYSKSESGVRFILMRTSGATLQADTTDPLTFGEYFPPFRFAISDVQPIGDAELFNGKKFGLSFYIADVNGDSANLESGTGYSVSLMPGTGTGALSGTTTGTVSAGSSSGSLSGLYYSAAESGVRFIITRTSGDNLQADTTDPLTFNLNIVDYGGGGTGSGGYYFANSTSNASAAPSQPSYTWIDEKSDTLDLNNADDGTSNDDGYWSVPIPFSFPFFGNPYTTAYVGSNGYISFGAGYTDYSASDIPSSGSPDNMIAWCFNDMVAEPGVTNIYYGGNATRFVVTYDSLETYDDDTQFITAQIILYPDGKILIQYNNDESSEFHDIYEDNCGIGIENGDGSEGISYRFEGSGGPMFDSNLALAFTTDQNALPVELTSFTAANGSQGVELTWSTASEVNNAGYEIQRLNDEKIANINTPLNPPSRGDRGVWAKIGYVEGSGTSSTPHSYSFTDAKISAGTYSYRLKQVDRNGNFKYSQEVEVSSAGVPKVFQLSQNFPNPFNPATTIEFTLQKDGMTTLKIYNVLGQEVATLVNEELKAGEDHRVVFNASNLASGTYVARLRNGTNVQMMKMTLLK